MGLDITFTRRKNMICPKCGEIVGHTDVDCAESSGRNWRPILESFGYYVPYEQRTKENDWYGKDMVLTEEQVGEVYRFATTEEVFNGHVVAGLIAMSKIEKDVIVVNADW